MKKRKILIIGSVFLILLLAALPFLSACGETTPGAYEIEIYGGKAGMSTYISAIALAELINENSTWLRATAIESINLTANFKLLMDEPERRPDTLIASMHQYHILASEGTAPYTEKYDGHRCIATTGYTVGGFVTLDPDIKTVADFKGKRVSIGDVVEPRVTILKTILEQAGVLDEVKLEYLSTVDGAYALRDGLIDVTLTYAFLRNPPDQYVAAPYLSELIATKTVYFVSMDSEDITYMNEVVGPLQVEHVVPAGIMGVTQTEPWVSLGAVHGWAADKDMPDDVVYEICRIIYENADQFADYSPSLSMISQDTMAYWNVPEADMHPGALQFYADYGVEFGSY